MSFYFICRIQNVIIHLLAGIIIVSFLSANSFIVQAQSNPPSLFGKTKKVSVNPNDSVDAGRFLLQLDTDHDGMPDDYEIANGTDPNNQADADGDLDNDGLSNLDEFTAGTNPRVADTDGDGFSDGEEVRQGYDPLDPNSHPPAGRTLVSIQTTPQTIGLSLNSLLGPASTQLTVIGTFNDNTTSDITRNTLTTYQSANPSIASVNSSGVILAVASGTTIVTVRNGGFSSQISIAVTTFSPSIIATLTMPGFANRVAVKGNFAYVACGVAGLQIIDVTVPEQAAIISHVPLFGNANDVKIQGNFAYVACGVGGLQIVDVSNPLSPFIVNSASFNGEATDIAVNGNFAYVAAGSGGLSIIDISSPNNPLVVASLPFNGNSIGIDINTSRNLAVLLVEGSLLQAIDITNPTTPQLLGGLQIFSGYSDIAVNGNFAYLSRNINSNAGIAVIDISNASQLRLAGNADVSLRYNDIAIKNGLAFSITTFIFNGGIPFFSLANPNQPRFLGSIGFSPSYQNGIGLTVTDSNIFFTCSRTDGNRNGVSGDTILQIIHYNQTDTSSIAPTVSIISPSANTTLVTGEQITVKVAANDDIAVAGVEIRANGNVIGNRTSPPYQTSFTVGSGSSVVFQAKAVDTANNVGMSLPVTIPIVSSDPGTTVIGQVIDFQGNSVNNATVKIEDGSNTTAISNFDGSFSFPGVRSLPLGITISVSVVDAQNRKGRSGVLPTNRGGVTDLGTVVVADTKVTTLPTTPSALAVADYNGDQYMDLFVGFDNQQSQVYLSDGNGAFNPSSSFILPFSAVRSGESIDINRDGFTDLLAQPVGQNGNATAVFSDGADNISLTSNFASGLSGESEFIAVGKNSDDTSVVAFLSNNGTTSLNVRFGDSSGNFSDPVPVFVGPSVALRTLKLVDINGDGLVDIVAIKQTQSNVANLVVYPRTGPNTFGSAKESVILVRSSNAVTGAVDYGLTDLNFDGVVDVVILGDDRVRTYLGDNTGLFNISSEITLDTDLKPLGIATAVIGGKQSMIVVGASKTDPTRRSLTLYLNRGSGLQVEKTFVYTSDQATIDNRVVIGNFGGNNKLDIVTVEGRAITSFLDISPQVIIQTEPPPVELNSILSNLRISSLRVLLVENHSQNRKEDKTFLGKSTKLLDLLFIQPQAE